MKKENQYKRIWKYLENHPEGITTLEGADRLRITKVNTRAGEMIAMGYPISKTPEVHINEDGNHSRIMRYRKAGEYAS